MPIFQPPLSYTSKVDVHPSPNEQAYIHLTFLATFSDVEDTSGTWEIWTDLPLLDDSGLATSESGSWRGIAFQPVDVGKALVDGHSVNGVIKSSTPALHLKATPLPEALKENVTRMSLSVSILANAGQHFAYTYRRVFPSGDVHWLGGEGSNGAISVVEGTMNGKRIGDASWQGEPPDDETVTFSGIGIEVSDGKDDYDTVIHHLPSEREVSANLLIISGTIPIYSTPFYRLSPSPIPRANYLNTPQAIHIASPTSVLTLPVGQMLPQTAGMESIKYFDNDGKMASVVGRAFSSAGKNSRFEKCKVIHDGKDAEDIVVLYHSGEDKSSLVVYAPNSLVEREIQITLPTMDVPIALTIGDETSFFPKTSKSSTLTIALPVGTVAESITIHEFVDISPNPSKSVYISALKATKIEHIAEVVPKSLEKAAAITPSPPTNSSREEDQKTSEMPGEYSSTPGDDVADQADVKEVWFLHAIGQFFVGFWEWICGVFVGKPAPPSRAESGEEEEDETEEEIMTPVTESTPLLGEASISRATSSATFSNQTSPITADTKQLPSTLVTPQKNLLSIEPSPGKGESAHTLFTFDKSPYKFLLASRDKEAVIFSTQIAEKWVVQDWEISDLGQGLLQVTVGSEEQTKVVKVELH